MFATSVAGHGLTEFDIHDVLNVFQCTGLNHSNKYFMRRSPTKAGDCLEFFAEIDLLCALSTWHNGADLPSYGGYGSILLGPFRTRFEKAETSSKTAIRGTGHRLIPVKGTMSALSNQRVAYFNGKIVPEREVVIPFRDRSFTKGDGVFDMTRSFNGRIFKIREHIDRLYRSLRYTRIDCGLKPTEMIEISEDVLNRNRHLLGRTRTTGSASASAAALMRSATRVGSM